MMIRNNAIALSIFKSMKLVNIKKAIALFKAEIKL